MIKYRQEIAAYTFRKYTRHIQQLLSHPSSHNKSSYQKKHVALPAGFGCRISNLGNNKSYYMEENVLLGTKNHS